MKIDSTLSVPEQAFLQASLTLRIPAGMLILRRLRHLASLHAGFTCTTSEEDLGKHSARSVATVKRHLTRLRGMGFLEIVSRRHDDAGQWLPNMYTLTEAGLRYLAHFEASPWLMHELQVLESEKEIKKSEETICSAETSSGEKTKDPEGEEETQVVGGRVYVFVKPRKSGITVGQPHNELRRGLNFAQNVDR
jgi:DNA-binding MarR family transcriptional regulator